MLVNESDESHDAERKSEQFTVRLLLTDASMTIPFTFFFFSGYSGPYFSTPQPRLKSPRITAHRQSRRRHTLSPRLIPQILYLSSSSIEVFCIQLRGRRPHPLRPQSCSSPLILWGSLYCFPSFHMSSHWTVRRRQRMMIPVHRRCLLRASR